MTKTAFITGAARGIGEGIARELALRGVNVALVGLEGDRLQMVASEINSGVVNTSDGGRPRTPPGRAIAIEADVTDSAALDRAVRETLTKFGRINFVVANAGIANNGSFASTHVEDLVRVVDVNLNGVIRTMKSTYNALLDSRGYALLISSASAFPAVPGITAYGASKAGVDHLANNLRLEMRAQGVDVGVAYLSWVDTDLVRDQYEELPYFRKALESEPMVLGRVTPLNEAVAILVEGILERRRRIYIPEFVGMFHLFRTAMVSTVWDMVLGFFASRMLPEMNEESRELGRSFGKTSAETMRRKK
jgi:NAD(P)-dependent dehydrogenase (short-subunit alcohol dehydrogenase family)